MNLGIALLLRGSSTDLPVTLQAIELAQRTTGVVHAIFMENGKSGKRQRPGEEAENDKRICKEQFIAMASRLGDVKGVNIHIHTLESLTDDLLIRFLCEYRIFCLILGAGNQDAVKRKTAWIERLRMRLTGDGDCFLPPLWSVIIRPWNDKVFDQIITGVTGAGQSSSAIKMMRGSLQNGLYRLNNTMKQKKKSLKGGKNVHVPSDSSHQC